MVRSSGCSPKSSVIGKKEHISSDIRRYGSGKGINVENEKNGAKVRSLGNACRNWVGRRLGRESFDTEGTDSEVVGEPRNGFRGYDSSELTEKNSVRYLIKRFREIQE